MIVVGVRVIFVEKLCWDFLKPVLGLSMLEKIWLRFGLECSFQKGCGVHFSKHVIGVVVASPYQILRYY